MEGNREAAILFGLLVSQMRYAWDGTPLGLDYNAVKFVLELYGVRNRRKTFEKLVVMERATIETWKERAKDDDGG